MISRFLSVIFSIIVIVVLAMVIINHNKFSSLVVEAEAGDCPARTAAECSPRS